MKPYGFLIPICQDLKKKENRVPRNGRYVKQASLLKRNGRKKARQVLKKECDEKD